MTKTSGKSRPLPLLDGRVNLWCGDCLEILSGLPDASIDSCVTDPPYHLTSIVKRFGAENAAPAKIGKTGAYARASAGFMGKQWDGGDIAFRPELWAEVLRVLKPGAHLVAFGGTRTYHRMACAIEDAGFEVRDMIGWMYGSGFPKSHDVSKGIDRMMGAERTARATGKPVKRMIPGADQNKDGWEKTNGREYVPSESDPATPAAQVWEGWGTALKPAVEPVVLARKPLGEGTVAANVLQHGTGAINIDGCRIPTNEGLNGGAYRDGEASAERTYADKGSTNFALKPGMRRGRAPMPGDERTGAALGMFQEGKTVGEQFKQPPGRWPANVVHDGSAEVVAAFPAEAGAFAPVHGTEPSNSTVNVYGARDRTATFHHGDSGSAARFFYTAKADSDDRIGSKHPTVKPVDLMQWLVRLVTPPGGVVLDPFAGTGTTGEAAWREGFRAVLIERETEYQEDIRRRMALCLSGPDERAREGMKAKMKGKPIDAGPLFGGTE